MNKMDMLKIVNALLGFSFVIQLATSIIIFFHIRVRHAQTVFDIHIYNGVVFFVLALAHLVLNWGWIKSAYLRRPK